jgi:hypothetical protein
MLGHTHGGDNTVQGKYNIQNHDLNNDGGKTRRLGRADFFLNALNGSMDFRGTFSEQKKATPPAESNPAGKRHDRQR